MLAFAVPGDEGGDFVEPGGNALTDRLVDENRRRSGEYIRSSWAIRGSGTGNGFDIFLEF